METIAATILASLLLAPAGAFAQTFSPANHTTLSAAAVREARSMAQREAPRPASPARAWVSKHPVGTAALIGAAAGAVIAATASSDTCRGSAAPACLIRSAAFGASAGVSVGTLAGYIVSFTRR